MDFAAAESYLLSLGNEVETMKLGLENIRRLLAALGNPETNYLKVQVAGTNGKGSVCAFLDSICLRARFKTGVFTSPHLMSITERVRIGGIDIAEAEFARLATLVRETSERMVAAGELETVPTYFEQVTAIALVAFREAKVELAILETGLGGRYDATTAANAEICAITRIDLDHQEYLGETIEEIAAEKAAIVRSDSKVVIGEQPSAARAAIEERLRTVKGGNTTGRECVLANWKAPSLPLGFPPVVLGLKGNHQIENAKVAVTVADLLQERFSITNEDIVRGLETARHPGRLEYIDNFLLDGAHNVAGAKALRAYLDEFVDKPITLIFGAMKDKKVAEIADILFPKAERIILTRPLNSRAMSAEELLQNLSTEVPADRIISTDSVEAALDLVRGDEFVLVTGSLYLVGEVRKLLNN